MRSERQGARAGWPLKIGAVAGIAFLHVPLLIIVLYAFSAEDKSYVFPPPALTLKWFAVAWSREDVRAALWLSIQAATVSTLVAMVLGTLAAAKRDRQRTEDRGERRARRTGEQARLHVAELVRRAMAGEEVVIAKDHKPVLRMVPIAAAATSRRPGSAKGSVWMAADFDKTPADFKPYTR